MLRVLRDWFVSLLAIFAALITVVSYVEGFFPKFQQEALAAVLFLGGFAILFFLESIWLRVAWGRERLYGRALPIINDGFSQVHDAMRECLDDQDIPLKVGKSVCETLVSRVAEAMSLVAGTRCSAAIKVLARDVGANKAYAVTFARSENTRRKRCSVDGPDYKHYIDDNTDFRQILENISTYQGRFFFANHLSLLYGYTNTSFKTYGKPHSNVILRVLWWPLPYKSSIVVPICPDIAEKKREDLLAGFLCIDARRPGAFRRNFDTDLLVGVADGVYNLLRRVDRGGVDVGAEAASPAGPAPE